MSTHIRLLCVLFIAIACWDCAGFLSSQYYEKQRNCWVPKIFYSVDLWVMRNWNSFLLISIIWLFSFLDLIKYFCSFYLENNKFWLLCEYSGWRSGVDTSLWLLMLWISWISLEYVVYFEKNLSIELWIKLQWKYELK